MQTESCNCSDSILKFYQILAQVRFTTSKKKLDAKHDMAALQAASLVIKKTHTYNLMELGYIVG